MPKKYKYPDLKALAAAFATGELKRDEYRLTLDNDDSFLTFVGKAPEGLNEEETDHWRDRKTDEASALFSGNGYNDLKDACEAAGIPAEWC